ncbi:MAG: site-2 protease family protein [Planctomycetota bacterium]
MLGSIKIGSVLGITIRVHVLLLVLAGFIVFGSGQGVQSAVLLGMIFGIILLHELAHSLVAMHFGLRVVDITLWPLGGMARMSQMPESSRIESLIAIAGPALNFVLAGIGLPFLLWTWTSETASPFMTQLAVSFVWGNLLLGGFNLLPAFPMDGGRVLRAFLGRNGNWVRATEQAVAIGRAIGVMLGLLGAVMVVFQVIPFQGFLLILVAMFVWWAGAQELLSVRARHGVDPLAAFREFAARATGWSQTQAASEFARAASGDPPPLRREPASSGAGAAGKPDAGFTDEELARLEQFRGPLSSFGPPPKG